MILNSKSTLMLIVVAGLIVGMATYIGFLREPKSQLATRTPPSTVEPSENGEWQTFTYLSSDSGILPTITFQYPPELSPASRSSKIINPPEFTTEGWGGFIDFRSQPGITALRIEFFEGVNDQESFETYVSKQAGDSWDDIKYFTANGANVARMRFSWPDHYDADVAWFFIQRGGDAILAISTSGDKELLYNDDANGYSTRDKIVQSLRIEE